MRPTKELVNVYRIIRDFNGAAEYSNISELYEDLAAATEMLSKSGLNRKRQAVLLTTELLPAYQRALNAFIAKVTNV